MCLRLRRVAARKEKEGSKGDGWRYGTLGRLTPELFRLLHVLSMYCVYTLQGQLRKIDYQVLDFANERLSKSYKVLC